jgi:hypothetical protein
MYKHLYRFNLKLKILPEMTTTATTTTTIIIINTIPSSLKTLMV